MSKIEQLIKEKCPNGVKKYKVGDICQVTRGRVISKQELVDKQGNYPVYSSQTLNNGVFGKINTFDFNGEYVQWTTDGANAGSIFYRNGKFSVTNVCGLLKVKSEYNKIINTKYLSYSLSLESKKYVNYATSNPKLMSNVMSKITVLIPPIEVQEEIVKILDKFSELETELETELESRKKQYEFYRRKLLSENYKKYKLENIAKFTYGYTGKALETGNARYIRITDISDNGHLLNNDKKYLNIDETNKKYILKKGDLVVARTGASYGKTLLFNDKFPGIYASFLIKIELNNNIVLNKYYWHFSKSLLYWNQANNLVSTAGQPQFNSNALKKIIIPIPPLQEQERIVKTLDKFDKLINDISEGIPAEIEARRKQYEYYRNKLLSFEELKTND